MYIGASCCDTSAPSSTDLNKSVQSTTHLLHRVRTWTNQFSRLHICSIEYGLEQISSVDYTSAPSSTDLNKSVQSTTHLLHRVRTWTNQFSRLHICSIEYGLEQISSVDYTSAPSSTDLNKSVQSTTHLLHRVRTGTNQFSRLRVSALLWCCVIYYQTLASGHFVTTHLYVVDVVTYTHVITRIKVTWFSASIEYVHTFSIGVRQDSQPTYTRMSLYICCRHMYTSGVHVVSCCTGDGYSREPGFKSWAAVS